ncbi:hypothetical protein [Paenibacillus xylanexedens]|uniref:hypothetical protein n=1 Tax=Paenibacillus xylanexedens TaxID=528191 RepID=UPI000F54881E|nr:hypothetical protein [Paenibacillus xylanexedens]
MSQKQRVWYWIGLALLIFGVILNLGVTYEKHKTNQEYKVSVDKFNTMIDKYDSIASELGSRLKEKSNRE